MSLSVTWKLPVNGQAFQYPLPRLIKAFILQNLSGSAITISTNSGDSITIPSGATQTITLSSSASTFTVQTSASTTGEAWLYGYDDPADVSQNQFLGTQNVNITNASLTVNGAITATISGPVAISGTVNISGTIQDLVVETNTGVTAGILANTVVSLSLSQGVTFTQTITKAIQGFAVVFVNPEGFLDIWYTTSGIDVYLISQYPFYSPVTRFLINGTRPLEKQLLADIPAGSVIKILFRQGTVNPISGMLKY